MLPRANRVAQPSEFRTAVRAGRRASCASAIVHVIDNGSGEPSRIGFIVSKAVGNAVCRNLVRRRLRAISREMLMEMGTGKIVVIRALPGSLEAGWADLRAQVLTSVSKAGVRR